MEPAPANPAAGKAPAAPAPPSAAPAPPPGAPAASAPKDGKKEKKKRKYSRDLRGVQTVERGIAKATHRLARSVERGLSTWRKESDRSARKRRDGAVRDAIENASQAIVRTLEGAARMPADFVDVVRPKVRTRGGWLSFLMPKRRRRRS